MQRGWFYCFFGDDVLAAVARVARLRIDWDMLRARGRNSICNKVGIVGIPYQLAEYRLARKDIHEIII